jgi:hypothetical protein
MSDHAPVHALWDAQSGPVHKCVRPFALWVAEDCSSMGWDGEACAHKRQTQRRRAARLQHCTEEPHGTGREGVTLEAAERRGGRQTRTSPSAWHKTAYAAISYQGLPKAKAGAHTGSCGRTAAVDAQQLWTHSSCGRTAAEQEKPEAPGCDWEQGTGLDWRTGLDWGDVHAARCEDFAFERFDALDLEADAVAHGLTTPRARTPLRIFVP